MARLSTFFTFMITAAALAEGLKRSLQATPRPNGVYVSTDEEASGQLTFIPGNSTFAMNIKVLECQIVVQGLKSHVVHVQGVTYDVEVTYAGTDLQAKVEACANPRIVIEDFDTLTFYFDPSTSENAIEMHSNEEEWDGRFEHSG